MTEATARIAVYDTLAPIAGRYDAWACDVWGVLHDGVEPFPGAVDACRTFRARGGTVVALTNAPRPHGSVAEQLDGIGVPRDAWDAIVSSGDVTRDALGQAEGPVFHLGPERDVGIFEGLDIALSDADTARCIVCTGLFDDDAETPDDYRGMLGRMAGNGATMICANPDIKVERGARLVWCAGALAAIYAGMGGEVIYAGKPYRPIYDLVARAIADARGKDVDVSRVLAIGDGLKTDIAGAAAAGLDALFIASGLHLTSSDDLDADELERLFADEPARPVAAMARLKW